MTKTEAIQHGEEQLKIFGGTHREFIEMALKALKQEPCELVQKAYEDGKKDGYVQAKVEQEPCDDCISRQAVLEKQYRIDDSATLSTRDVVNVEDIFDLPSVMPKCPPQDEQNICHCMYCPINKSEDKMLVCPNCGLDVHSDFKYCPRCGEKMIASQEKRCADCNHYGKLSLDCGRCDDDCSMFEQQESEG